LGMVTDISKYEIFAAIFKLMSEQEYNCHWIGFQSSRKPKLCNTGQQVLVGFIAVKNEVSSAVKPDDAGYMYNHHLLRVCILDFFRKKVRAEFAKVTGRIGAETNSHVRYVEDNCMGRDSWRDCL
jgi:hypothetical protein